MSTRAERVWRMRMRTLGVLSCLAGALTCAAQQGATPGTAVPLAVVGKAGSSTKDTLAEVQASLRANPPSSGHWNERRGAILALDGVLSDDAARTDPAVKEFYRDCMEAACAEMREPVTTGMRIWSMYNHGYVIRTASATLAFDLVNGYPGWDYRLPDDVLAAIKVLFISHRHADHCDPDVVARVRTAGGAIVAPAEDEFGTVRLLPNAAAKVAGLDIVAHPGSHQAIPLRIYRVTTPEGLTILHTGDHQWSWSLPDDKGVDVLLLNNWVNNGGFVLRPPGQPPAIPAMKLCIKRVRPVITIPGHMQEMAHHFNLEDLTSRTPFAYPLAVASDFPPGAVVVQVFGERFDYIKGERP